MKYLKYFETDFWERKQNIVKKFKAAMKKFNDDEEVINYIIENCSEWLENPTPIERVIDTETICFKSKPVKRYSRDNSNEYTLLMDHLPKWKNYPKRSKSFICSLGKSHLGALNDYCVIPENGAMWGVAPQYDIFFSFKNNLSEEDFPFTKPTIDNFFKMINAAATYYHITLSDTNYIEFRKQIRELQKKDIENLPISNSYPLKQIYNFLLNHKKYFRPRQK